ncbi:MAG: hypothetical protein M3Y52_04765, partial [Actinomycetota bacterium]|nr:hypothetical protein [Actinomycetota bacterium]
TVTIGLGAVVGGYAARLRDSREIEPWRGQAAEPKATPGSEPAGAPEPAREPEPAGESEQVPEPARREFIWGADRRGRGE